MNAATRQAVRRSARSWAVGSAGGVQARCFAGTAARTPSSGSSSVAAHSKRSLKPITTTHARLALQAEERRVKFGSFEPHPFNCRFAEDTRPFFPLMAKNLRQPMKPKKNWPRGRGKSGRKGTDMIHQATIRTHNQLFTYGRGALFQSAPVWRHLRFLHDRRTLSPLNLAKLRNFIEAGRIDTSEVITMRHMVAAKLVKSVRYGVKLFNVNDYPFPYKIRVECSAADQSSIDALRRVGGEVRVLYHTVRSLRSHLRPRELDAAHKAVRPPLRMVHFLEKMRARGASVQYVRPAWLMREEADIASVLRRDNVEPGRAPSDSMLLSRPRAPRLKEGVAHPLAPEIAFNRSLPKGANKEVVARAQAGRKAQRRANPENPATLILNEENGKLSSGE